MDPSYAKFPAEGGDRSMCVSALGVSAACAEEARVHLWACCIGVAELVGGEPGELAEHVGCQFAVKERTCGYARGSFARSARVPQKCLGLVTIKRPPTCRNAKAPSE